MPKYLVNTQEKAFSVASMISSLNLEKAWDITIEPHADKRTLPQNALMWRWYTIIGNEIGYTKDEMHNLLREMFLPWEEIELKGVKQKRLMSTSTEEFKTKHMSAYLDAIDRFAASDLRIILPRSSDAAYDEWSRIR
jgi:hypothetical protein